MQAGELADSVQSIIRPMVDSVTISHQKLAQLLRDYLSISLIQILLRQVFVGWFTQRQPNARLQGRREESLRQNHVSGSSSQREERPPRDHRLVILNLISAVSLSPPPRAVMIVSRVPVMSPVILPVEVL